MTSNSTPESRKRAWESYQQALKPAKATLYAITWEDAHGDVHDTLRAGKAAADYIAELFKLPGCELLCAEAIDSENPASRAHKPRVTPASQVPGLLPPPADETGRLGTVSDPARRASRNG